MLIATITCCNPQQLDDRAVALGLRQQLRDAVDERDTRCIDQDDRGVARSMRAVTMLRVYCSWPGVSAMMNLRFGGREVAVRDVDRDALLALGLQAVRQQRQVDVVADRALVLRARERRSWSDSMALLSNSRRPISVLLPSSTLPR